jgi:hypothetical protein
LIWIKFALPFAERMPVLSRKSVSKTMSVVQASRLVKTYRAGDVDVPAVRAFFLNGDPGTEFGERQNSRRYELQARLYF